MCVFGFALGPHVATLKLFDDLSNCSLGLFVVRHLGRASGCLLVLLVDLH